MAAVTVIAGWWALSGSEPSHASVTFSHPPTSATPATLPSTKKQTQVPNPTPAPPAPTPVEVVNRDIGIPNHVVFQQKAESLANGIPYSTSLTAIQLSEAIASCAGAGTDKDKMDRRLAAAIAYCWVAKNLPYDVESLDPRSRLPQDPDQVLRSRKAVCEGYSCLYTFLLNQMEIEAQVIHGIAKTSSKDIGKTLNKGDSGHAWAAVRWDQDWHLVECTWGAGTVSANGFSAEFTWDRFDMNPKAAIYSHFPEQDRWQLLEQPWTVEKFAHAAILKPGFFNLVDVSIDGDFPATIKTSDPKWLWKWKAKAGTSLLASAESWPSGTNTPSTNAVEWITPDGVSEFRFPGMTPGRHLLNLYAKRDSGEKNKPYHLIAAFVLDLTASLSQNASPVTHGKFAQIQGRLIRPSSGALPAGRWEDFEITAPPGLTLALQLEGETTLSHLSYTDGRYFTRMMLRPGKLRLYSVESDGMWRLLDFEITPN